MALPLLALRPLLAKAGTQFAMKKGGGSAFSQLLSSTGKGGFSLDKLSLGDKSGLSRALLGGKSSPSALGGIKNFQAGQKGPVFGKGMNLAKGGLNKAGGAVKKVAGVATGILNDIADVAEDLGNQVFSGVGATSRRGFSGPDM